MKLGQKKGAPAFAWLQKENKHMNRAICFILNREKLSVELPAGMVLLDFIRQQAQLKGTKEGCREGECGACTVLIGELKHNRLAYKSVASCLLPIGQLQGKHIVTIEGLNQAGLNPIQNAYVEAGASQCGFCTPGFIISLAHFFLNSPHLSEQDALEAMDGNICRCTGYVSIQKCASNLSQTFRTKLDKHKNRISQLVDWAILPDYFLDIQEQLKTLPTQDKQSPPLQTRILVGGGTDLFVQRPEQLSDSGLEFTQNFKESTVIKEDQEHIYLGAGTTVTDLKKSALLQHYFPDLDQYLNLVSSTLMRNSATLAGNIVNASPIGDLSVFFLVLNTQLVIAGSKNQADQRTIALHDFFKAYKKTALQKGEKIVLLYFRKPAPDQVFNFEKVSRRTYLDIASCNTAMFLTHEKDTIKKICLSAGGVAPIPLILNQTAKFLTGQKIGPALLEKAARIADSEIRPISDVRGSEEYKRILLKNLLWAHFNRYFPEQIQAGQYIYKSMH